MSTLRNICVQKVSVLCALGQSCYGLSAGWPIPTHPEGKVSLCVEELVKQTASQDADIQNRRLVLVHHQ